MPLSTSQARQVDPVVTTVVQAYANQMFKGGMLFPRVTHPLRGGTTITFGREAFALYNTERGPGQDTKRIQIGYDGAAFAMEDHSLEGALPREIQQEASVGARINMAREATAQPMEAIRRKLEYDQATIATTAGNYDTDHKITLSGTTQWSHASSAPINQLKTGMEAIRASIGQWPNTLLMGPAPWISLCEHANILARLPDNVEQAATPEFIGRILNPDAPMNVTVASATRWDAANSTFVDIWGDFAILAFVPQNGKTLRTPSYGYTYALPGTPFGEPPYEDKRAKSTIYPVTDTRVPVMTGMLAGYLFIDCTA